MTMWMTPVLIVIGYFFGSIPVAGIVGSRSHPDLRETGDRNPGLWNAREVFGKRRALFVLVGDLVKGALPVLLALNVLHHRGIAYVVLFAAMVGHAYPVFARFRGGRSVLTFCGGAFVMHPTAGVLALLVGALISATKVQLEVALRRAMFAIVPLVQIVDGWRSALAVFLLQSFIGLRFWLARRSARARSSFVQKLQ